MYHEWISILSKAEVVQSAISYHGHVSARNPMHENIYIIFNIYFYIHNTEVVLGGGTKMPFCTTQIFQPGRPQEWWFFGDLCYTFWKALHEDLRHQAPEMEHLEIEPSDANNYTDTMDEILITGADVWK